MLIQDLNYVETVSDEIIGGEKPGYVHKTYAFIDTLSLAEADAKSVSTGGVVSLTSAYAGTYTAPGLSVSEAHTASASAGVFIFY